MALADTIQDIEHLEDQLSKPTAEVVQTLGRLEGDLIVLGVAGKMGPSLARMARRASDLAGTRRRIIGVARFSSAGRELELQQHGIETIRCDLLDDEAVRRLPDAPNVLHLAGMKFGATGQESLTWAMNTHLPAIVCRKFARSRIVGGLLGHWAVWTRQAVELQRECHRIIESGSPVPAELLRRAAEVTDCNAAFFGAANNFAGCIPGLHEVLRRQGLLEGIWCLDPRRGSARASVMRLTASMPPTRILTTMPLSQRIGSVGWFQIWANERLDKGPKIRYSSQQPACRRFRNRKRLLMQPEMSRRSFVKETLLSSAGLALALTSRAEDQPKPAAHPAPCPRGRSESWT